MPITLSDISDLKDGIKMSLAKKEVEIEINKIKLNSDGYSHKY